MRQGTRQSQEVERLDNVRNEVFTLRTEAGKALLNHAGLLKNLSDFSNHLTSNSLAVRAIMETQSVKAAAPICELYFSYLEHLYPQEPGKAWNKQALSLLHRRCKPQTNLPGRAAAELTTDVLAVAQALQTIVSSGRHNSLAAFICHYRILYDLHRGGAHALLARNVRESAPPAGAYVLNQCVYAYFMWKSALESRAEAIRAAARTQRALRLITNCPRAWQAAEIQRLALSLCVHLLACEKKLRGSPTIAEARRIFVQLSQVDPQPIERSDLDRLLEFILTDSVRETALGLQNLTLAQQICSQGPDLIDDRADWLHEKVIEAISKGARRLQDAKEKLEEPNTPTEARLQQAADILDQVAQGLVNKLWPFNERFDLVLEQQRARVTRGHLPDLAEMLPAATSYGYLTGDWQHPNLLFTVRSAIKALGDEAVFPAGTPIDLNPATGTVRHVIAPQLIRLLFEIAAENPEAHRYVKERTIQACTRHFRGTRKPDRGVSDCDSAPESGWFLHDDRSRSPQIWITASVCLALRTLHRFLDKKINEVVFKEVAVRRANKLTLEDTAYPDYGLALAEKRESIAIRMQHARAHIAEISGARKGYHSFILHGPPGTGKTTFPEALSATCKVPIVEITPSDILTWGEPETEARTRHLFSLLACLTDVVIIFDEFDSVLQARPQQAHVPHSVYEFLTPGLLPKLKKLHGQAKANRVVYLLATNYVGNLDSAATREGRFDQWIPIFSPDPLSRLGLLTAQYAKASAAPKLDSSQEARIVQLTRNTADVQMERLIQFIRQDLQECVDGQKPPPERAIAPKWEAIAPDEQRASQRLSAWNAAFAHATSSEINFDEAAEVASNPP